MKIYSMTATFGKLEHETLTLTPGLNIIEAPNEWGKSTWCAFLVTMLYGLDTRAKSTRTALADKERYAPWSGSPMAGRIDLNWNGRDITIERRSKGRIPMGEFIAYETESGLPVTDFTGIDCGRVLLGVERSVFTRAGFIKQADLPVTQDDSLRRRLNALVTTGDESGAGDKLAQKLKELKNRCRFNRTGLLPQAEAERDELEKKLSEISYLHGQAERLRQRQVDVEQRIAQLENHKVALNYKAAQADEARVAQTVASRDAAKQRLELLEYACRDIPARAEAEKNIRQIQELNQQWLSLQMESKMLPGLPDEPQPPAPFRALQAEAAVLQAERDRDTHRELAGRKELPLLLLGILALVAAAVLAVAQYFIPAAICAVAGGVLLIARAVRLAKTGKARRGIEGHYGSSDPDSWVSLARQYAQEYSAYEQSFREYQTLRGDLEQRLQQLERQLDDMTQGQSLPEYQKKWEQVITAWDDCADAQRDLQRKESDLRILQSVARTAKAPEFADDLTCDEEQTARLISDALFEQRQLQLQLGKCQGMIESLGSEEPIRTRLRGVKGRIVRLEETYAALEFAQKALSAASTELQRRFAPRISKRAQQLFARLTDGRYDRLLLGEDLSLSAGAQGEDTLHSSLWRSDGTADQLYLSLRLAVAEELTPEAPLILDDALVRFDDKRLSSAMEILKEESEYKQVILFTCQGREKSDV